MILKTNRFSQYFKEALDSSALRKLKLLCRKNGFTFVDKVYYLKKKLSISPFIKILEPLHVHIVHMASISYWSKFIGIIKCPSLCNLIFFPAVITHSLYRLIF